MASEYQWLSARDHALNRPVEFDKTDPRNPEEQTNKQTNPMHDYRLGANPIANKMNSFHVDPTALIWFDRVSVLKKAKVLTCGIEKNGITLLAYLIALSINKPFEYLPLNPDKVNMKMGDIVNIINGSNGWNTLVAYRDPMERFLSAYKASTRHS